MADQLFRGLAQINNHVEQSAFGDRVDGGAQIVVA
jgi:hypothetical protein